MIYNLYYFGFFDHMKDNYRWQGTFSLETGHFQSRYGRWEILMSSFWDKPFIGHGIGTVASVGVTSFEYMSAHNLYIKILIETGLLGFFGYVLLMATLLFNMYKIMKKSYKTKDKNLLLFVSILTSLTFNGEESFGFFLSGYTN